MSGIGYFGCKPDPVDLRDRMKVYEMVPSSLEYPTVDLRQYVTVIYNQGRLNSCTANAVCSAYKLDLKKDSVSYVFDSSRLFLYYKTRVMEDRVSEDSGASIRDTVKSIAKGVCKESSWPYDTDRFKEKPCQSAYDEATGNVVSEYVRLHPDVDQFRACLKDNSPFVFAFTVFENFLYIDNPRSMMSIPVPNEKILGHHAVVAVGYDDRSRVFTILNSWGKNWGDGGYFYMPYEFISDSKWCRDFWKITFEQQDVEAARYWQRLVEQGHF